MINFCIGTDIPEDADGYIFYQNCPMCGEKITERIKTDQLEYNINRDNIDERPNRRKRKYKQKKRIKRQKSRIPKRKSRFKK